MLAFKKTRQLSLALSGDAAYGSNYTTMNKFYYAASTLTTTTSPPAYMYECAGFSDVGVAGYASRGADAAGIYTANQYRWGFPTDTVTTISDSPGTVGVHAAFSNPGVAGYEHSGGGGNRTSIYKLAFPAETWSTTTSSSTNFRRNAGFADYGVAGYIGGGVLNNIWNKFSFPTDTRTVYSQGSGSADSGGCGFPGLFGILFYGGQTTFKRTFSTETVSFIFDTLPYKTSGQSDGANNSTSEGIIFNPYTGNVTRFTVATEIYSVVVNDASVSAAEPAVFSSN